ncbi:MAG: hypothetical protein ROO73_04795 [Roseivirga sp.]
MTRKGVAGKEKSMAQKVQRVLESQNARKLHYKRQIQVVRQERARKSQEAVEKKRQLKESTALLLLEKGQPAHVIAQATGLTEAEINSLRGER